jgi:hypothetical protein
MKKHMNMEGEVKNGSRIYLISTRKMPITYMRKPINFKVKIVPLDCRRHTSGAGETERTATVVIALDGIAKQFVYNS